MSTFSLMTKTGFQIYYEWSLYLNIYILFPLHLTFISFISFKFNETLGRVLVLNYTRPSLSNARRSFSNTQPSFPNTRPSFSSLERKPKFGRESEKLGRVFEKFSRVFRKLGRVFVLQHGPCCSNQRQ